MISHKRRIKTVRDPFKRRQISLSEHVTVKRKQHLILRAISTHPNLCTKKKFYKIREK